MPAHTQKLLEHGLTAALSVVAAGVGFFMLEASQHITREEFQRNLDAMAPIIRQMDEERGRVEARLTSIESRLAELTVAVKELAKR